MDACTDIGGICLSIITSKIGIDWPAWVQAVGSFIAIGIAIIVPWRIWKSDRNRVAKEQQARKIVLAGAIVTEVYELKRALVDLKAATNKIIDPMLATPPTERRIRLIEVAIPCLPLTKANLLELYLFGPIGGQRVMYLQFKLSSFLILREIVAKDVLNDRNVESQLKSFLEALDELDSWCNKVSDAVRDSANFSNYTDATLA